MKTLIGTLALFCVACADVRTEASSVLHEDAKVAAKNHFAAHTETDLQYKPAFGFDGKYDFRLVPVTVSVPEKYQIVFSCDHGQFAIGNTNSIRLWDDFQIGDWVDVEYREIYHVTYEENKPVKRELYRLDFLNATKKDDRVERR